MAANSLVTSAANWNKDKIYLFRGNQYFRYDKNKRRVDPGYPRKNFGNLWDGQFVAVLNHPTDSKKVYFFHKNQEYVRWTIGKGPDEGYPRKMNWKGVPFAMTGAVNWKGNKAYFFRGNEYFRYDFETKAVDPGYPRTGFVKELSSIQAAINFGNGIAYFYSGDKYVRWTIGKGADGGYPKSTAQFWKGITATKSGQDGSSKGKLEILSTPREPDMKVMMEMQRVAPYIKMDVPVGYTRTKNTKIFLHYVNPAKVAVDAVKNYIKLAFAQAILVTTAEMWLTTPAVAWSTFSAKLATFFTSVAVKELGAAIAKEIIQSFNYSVVTSTGKWKRRT